MADRIIDFEEYVRRREEEDSEGTFALWGADGERSRFALPLWRAAYLCSATRAALVWEVADDRSGLRPMVVLDLAHDPAKLGFPDRVVAEMREIERPPALSASPDGVSVFLGQRGRRRWYLVMTEVEDPEAHLEPRAKDDLHFLAGECAGLIFDRKLDLEQPTDPPTEAGDPEQEG